MTEVWYAIKTKTGTTMITDYMQAQKCKENGAEVEVVLKSRPDHMPVVDEERRRKILEHFGYKAKED